MVFVTCFSLLQVMAFFKGDMQVGMEVVGMAGIAIAGALAVKGMEGLEGKDFIVGGLQVAGLFY